MAVAHHLLVLLHLVAFAALLGGSLVQLRSREPEISTAMLHGAWVGLASGVALWVLAGTFDVRVSTTAMVVKVVVGAVVTLLVVLNRRFFSIPRGLLRLITLFVLAEAAVAVFW
jgi:L-cystine uptake protein TcyP (sodium:dicarboxylate symporter family)